MIIIACVGLTFILKYGKPINFIRNFLSKSKIFEELFKCSLCLGFWAGVLLGAIHYRDVQSAVFLGLASSAASWILDSFNQYVQIQEVKIKKDLSNLD